MIICRYSMTVVSNISVYLVAWGFFGMSQHDQLSSADAGSFRNIMIVVIGLGAVTSLLFHLIVEEEVSTVSSGYQEINGEAVQRDLVEPMGIKDWFKEPQFYQIAGVYMSTRLFVNLSQAYIPLYLQVSVS